MEIFVETERLILRELLPTDLDGMYELDSDFEVHKYLGNNPIKDKDQLLNIINFVRQQYVDNGIGRWAITEKLTNKFIGWSGLKFVKELTNNHINFYDLGYRLIRKYWGQGYAKESAIASLSYGFEIIKLEEIFAAAHIENNVSNSILNKIGFQKQETFIYEYGIQNWYKIDKNAWNTIKLKV